MGSSKEKDLTRQETCFWCELEVSGKSRTRDHLMPLGMGGKHRQIVIACYSCNQERGRVTELYSLRQLMIKNIEKRPEMITRYKNRFRKKVQKMSELILKWEILHREKGLLLPFSILEIIKLDEPMPLLCLFPEIAKVKP